MKRALGIALGLALLAGCARETVNDYSLFKYKASDGTALQAAKTAGNLVPWTMLAAGAILVVPVAIAALCNYQP